MHSIDDSPKAADVEFLDDQLEAFNAQATGRDDYRPLNLAVRHDDDSIVAGLKAVTGWDWLYIQVLWVHEDHRRSGLGRRLMKQAEEEARGRGCIGSCLSTFSFQAPQFYERCGYSFFGQIDDYPTGHKMLFMSKRFG